MNFRSEVFELCKVIKKNNIGETANIVQLIHDLNVFVEKENTDDNIFTKRTDFGYISKNLSNQFFGYLYTDENIASYKEVFPKIENLDEKEKKIIAQGHATIIAFVEGCLQDFKVKYPRLYDTINPYSKYKPIKTISEKSLLTEDEYENAIKAFRNTKIYQKLFSSKIIEIFEGMTEEHIIALFGALERDILRTPLDVVKDDIRDFSLRILNKIKDVSDVMIAESILILALRESLVLACQLLFVALAGEDLILLNNDNIIRIENNHTNVLYKVMTVLVDSIILRYSTKLLGDILLIDCDPIEKYHIHEFGTIRSSTISFNNETGQTTKVTFAIIDEDMNFLHILTDAITRAEFP